MSDTLGAELPEEPDAPLEFVGPSTNPRMQAIGALYGEADPDKAVRAHELSKATGLPPSAVYADVENVDQQVKNTLSAHLVNNNTYLRDYVNSHPLAAKVSHDDWGKLNDVTDTFLHVLEHSPTAELFDRKVMKEVVEGFQSQVQMEGIGENLRALDKYYAGKLDAEGKLDTVSAIGKSGWYPLIGSLDIVILGMHVLAGGIIGGTRGIGQYMSTITGDERWVQEGQKFGEAVQDPGLWASIGPVGEAIGSFFTARHINRTIDNVRQVVDLQQAVEIAAPYILDGRPVPTGLHPLIDKIKVEQAEADAKAMPKLHKEVQGTNTFERSPDFARLALDRLPDHEFGLKPDAVREMYGEKEPVEGDGKLGDVITGEQLREAEAGGTDLSVGAKDWFTKVDPAVAKELEEHIRYRRGGLTSDEATTVRASIEEDEALEKITSAAIKVGDQVWIGTHHGEAILKAEDDLGRELDSSTQNDLTGFMTSKDRYVSREEAVAIANKADQFKYPSTANVAKKLLSEDIKPGELSHNGEALRQTRASAGLEGPTEGAAGLAREDLSAGVETLTKPTETYTAHEQRVVEQVQKVLSRIAPELTDVRTVPKIEMKGREVAGVYVAPKDAMPLVAVALDARDAGKTARHEAIHFLRDYGFFKDVEWAALEKAAKEDGWLGKHNIRERYKAHAKDEGALLEEAIAEEFGEWGSTTEAPRAHYNDAVNKAFTKLAEFFKEILTAMKELFGHSPTIDELFEKIESGEVGRRAQEGQGQGGVKTQEGEAKKPFDKGNALGLTEAQYNRKLGLIEKQRKEDAEYLQRKYEEEERKKQTPEWKAQREKLHQEISDEMPLRPSVAADRLFAEGKLPDGSKAEPPKMDSAMLTVEQKAALPDAYYGRGGQNPDHIASYLGFHTGDDMVAALSKYTAEREASGMTPQAYMRRIADIETDRRMAAEHGELQANILADAMEHVASETTFDILHEDTLAAAIRAKAEFSITKGQFKAGILDGMDTTRMAGVSSTKFFEAAGRAGREAVAASDKGDFVESFRQQQRQYAAMVMAKEGLKLEKEQKAFDKFAKKYAKSMKIDREVKVAPEYLNFVYRLLADVGKPIGRSEAHLAEAMRMEGFSNIGELIADKQRGYPENNGVPTFDLPIADFLLDGTFKKNFDELTVEEFRGVNDAVKVLEKQGRGETRLIKEGDSIDRQEAIEKMKGQVVGFADNVKTLKDSTVVKKSLRQFLAGMTNFETFWNRMDRNNPRGLFNQYLVRPLTSAANYEATLQRETAKPYKELGKVENPTKLMASPLLDPNTGKPLAGFTREKALVILQNMGNKSNWDSFTRGWKADPEALRDWVFANLTKEDFDRAQKMGDTVFKPLFDKAKTMYHSQYGVMPEEIQLTGVKTPWKDANGNDIIYKGWYHPLIRDDFYETKGELARKDPSKKETFKRAQTLNGYAKARTGAAYPIDLTFDKIPGRIAEMIHDIAFRQAILETGKILNDKGLRAAIAIHYGEEYRDMIDPYIRDIAGAYSRNSKAEAQAARVSEYFRQNAIGTYIGFNPLTAFKHGPTAWVNSMTQVGAKQFIRAFADATSDLYGKSPEVGLSWKKFVDKYSEEVGRRERHWDETIGGVHDYIQDQNYFMQGRAKALQAGSWLVAKSDMASARPTWLAAYRNAIKDGMDHGEAIFEGDRAVRFAHGSTAITNQPGIVRGGGMFNSWNVSLYGFFGTMMQRRIQLMHEMNDIYKLGRERELKEVAKALPGLGWRVMSYVVIPTAIEEAVTSIGTDDHRGWGQRIALGAATGITSSVPYLRDIIWPLIHGHKPELGLSGSPLGDIENTFKDLKMGKKMFSKEHAGKTVEDFITTFGIATGVAPKQVGHVTRFGLDTASGQARPRVLNDAVVGSIKGTMKRRVEK